MSKRRAYDVSLKLKAVEYAEKTSKEVAARHFGVDTKRIREWSSQRDELLSMPKGLGPREETAKAVTWSWPKSSRYGLGGGVIQLDYRFARS